MPIIPDSRMYRVKTPSEIISENKQKDLLEKEIIDISKLSIIEKYSYLCNQIISEGKENEFTNKEKEWNYILSDKNSIENLMENLNNYGLLLDDNKICDCGIGLGETLFRIYQQTLKITDKKFEFYGIEKNKFLYESFDLKLRDLWENISLINDDIMYQDLSKYNIIYTYTPFKSLSDLNKLYTKIVDELPTGGILIENHSKGAGIKNCLINFIKEDYIMEIIDVEGFFIYQKI